MNDLSKPSLSSILIVAFFAIGVPSAASVYPQISQIISHSPLEAVEFLIFYEVAVAIISFVGYIWKNQFQDVSAKKVADSIKNLLRYPLGYKRRYYRNLLVKNEYIKGLGLPISSSLKLEQIFVEPIVTQKDFSEFTSDPIAPPLDDTEGEQSSVWSYIASRDVVVILGPAGLGKSTLLQYIILTLYHQKKLLKFKIPQLFRSSMRYKIPYKLPFLLSLREVNEALKENENISLIDMIENDINKKWNRSQTSLGWVEHTLNKRCLILLDGLDEIADKNERQKVTLWIQKQIDSYRSNNGFIITSRPLSYREAPLESGGDIVELQGFDEEKIIYFINKWYKATGKETKKAEDLKKELNFSKGKQKLFDLACNPLLLGMIIVVHEERGRLPDNRIKLYKEIFDLYTDV